MISRDIEPILRKALMDYPVVTVFGPRQSGKTTLAKMVCPDYEYVTLEDRETRDLALSDYKAFFSRHQGPMIIDEIQRVPEIVSAIQVEVDRDRTRNGTICATISQQPHRQGSQSLDILFEYLTSGILPDSEKNFVEHSIRVRENI